MSLAALKEQLYGRLAPSMSAYQPQTKLAIALQEMIGLISRAGPGNPIVAAIAAASSPVVRKVDGQPEDQQRALLEGIEEIMAAALDASVDAAAFRQVMQDQGAKLKTLVAAHGGGGE